MKYRYPFSIVIGLAIAILSLIPVPEVPELEDVPFFDKWVHFIMYGALTCGMYLDRHISKKALNKTYITFAFVFPSLYGGLMELLQAYCTTCRSGEWLDFYADTFGALLATLISLTIWKIVKTSVQK